MDEKDYEQRGFQDVRQMVRKMPPRDGRPGYWFILDDLCEGFGRSEVVEPMNGGTGPQSNHDVQRRIMETIRSEYGPVCTNIDGASAEFQTAELEAGTIHFDSEGSAFGCNSRSYEAMMELACLINQEQRGAIYERMQGLAPGELCDGRTFDRGEFKQLPVVHIADAGVPLT
jgi:hypothetical protein